MSTNRDHRQIRRSVDYSPSGPRAGFPLVQLDHDTGPGTDANIFRDPRIRSIAWRDLIAVRADEVIAELLLPCVWLALSLAAAGRGWHLAAFGLSFIVFLAGLRVVHHAFHHALGLPRWADSAVLWGMSLVMVCSLDAVRFNHPRHHRLVLGEGDVESRSAAMPWWRALLYGPWFTLLLHSTALCRRGTRLKVVVAAQLMMSATWVFFVFRPSGAGVLRYDVMAMGAAHCLSSFFAVWTVHHHCDRTHNLARTLRNRIKNAITFDMFRHVEHHLFPAVPTRHLAELSARLDQVAPELKIRTVF